MMRTKREFQSINKLKRIETIRADGRWGVTFVSDTWSPYKEPVSQCAFQ